MVIAKELISTGYVYSPLEDRQYGPQQAVVEGDRLFFVASDSPYSSNKRLWLSDGTVDGTGPIAPAPGQATPLNPSDFTAFKGGVLFAASDPEHGQELWFTDGNRNGARLIADLEPGGGFAPTWITAAGQRAFFTSSGTRSELWTTDGTAAGTRRVKAFPLITGGLPLPDYLPSIADITALDSNIVFTLSGPNSREIWSSDGTDAGTTFLCGLTPGFTYQFPDTYNPPQTLNSNHHITSIGNRVFFVNRESTTSYELWTSDATPAGTKSLRTFTKKAFLATYPYYSLETTSISEFAATKDRLFFVADDGDHGKELWSSDGTPEGTALLKDILPEPNYSSDPRDLTIVGQSLFFTAEFRNTPDGPFSTGLWISDGTTAGTSLVISADQLGSSPRPIAQDGTYLYFTTAQGQESSDNQELIWRTDGTNAGTVPLYRAVNRFYDIYTNDRVRAGVVINGQLIYQSSFYRTMLASVPLTSEGPLAIDQDQVQACSGLVLLHDQAGVYWVSYDGEAASTISWGGTQLRSSTLPDWQLLAGVGSGRPFPSGHSNSLLWRHRSSGTVVTWELDETWTAISGSAPVAADSPEARRAEALFQVDLDGDQIIGTPQASLARVGSTSLLLNTATGHLAVAVSSGNPVDLTWDGAPLLRDDPRLQGWTALAAANLSSGNALLWRHGPTGLLTSWSCDGAWKRTGGSPLVAWGSAEADALEVAFGFDANQNGTIGSAFTLVASVGSVRLLRHDASAAYAIVTDGLNPVPLVWAGIPLQLNDPRLPDWTPLAASTDAGVNRLLWRHGASGALATWTFDAGWNASSGDPPVSPTSATAYTYETAFGLDANADGTIGSPTAALATVARVGAVALLRSLNGQRLSVAVDGARPIELSWDGTALLAPDPRIPEWTALAAATLSTGNTLLWRHGSTGVLTTWTCDGTWNPIVGGAFVSGDSADADDLETSFQIDVDGDGSIGGTLLAIARVNDAALLRQGESGHLIVADRTGTFPLSWGGSALLGDDARLRGWTALAAATVDGINTLLWRHAYGDLTTWTCDASWTPTTGQPIVEEESAAGLALETAFGCDANRDGFIGEPISPVERLRARILSSDHEANARDPFSSVVSGGSQADRLQAPAGENVLLTGQDLVTGRSLDFNSVDILDCGISNNRCTILVDRGDTSAFSSYTLIRNFDRANDDLVLALGTGNSITTASRTLPLDGSSVSGLGLHLDSNRNGLYDPADDLIALLEGTTDIAGRVILI